MRRPDHHNEIELNFLESGTVTYLLGGRKTVVQAGRLSAFWAAIPHQIIDFGREPTYFVATIPLQCFLQWRLPEHFVQRLMQGQLLGESDTERAGSDARLFGDWESDLVRQDPGLDKVVLLEMHARLMRLARGVPELGRSQSRRKAAGGMTDAGLNKVEQMACFIAQRYTDRLRVEEIAAVVKLHPNYAMGLFQRTFGTTLIAYLTQHRVSHAQRLLATTDQTVADIAFGSGFNSISRFNDAFRRVCGCSPREYRRSHRLVD
jgi:AraC-like DNA-binding protein